MADERVQRRLAAILAADLVGYSRLMGDDEAGTLAALNLHRAEFIHPTVAEYRGRIVKLMGDGALVEFASVVDAVECAVAIQRGMGDRNGDVPESKQIAFRIGINLGDVIIDGDDIYGDGVNVAARLEGLAEPGGVCISDLVHRSVASKLELAFEDLGDQSVENIAQPIRVYRVDISRQPMPGSGSSAADAEILQRPALAVLPFENMGGDPEQAYFADGLTEDIITALSLWRSFPVIARHSTFVYKGEAVNVQEVGQTLGARYVLEGSVRKAGDRVRVTAQLIDADSGHHVWAERFDRHFEDIFDLQDELTQQIAAIVAPELERVGRNRVTVNQPQNLDAWTLVQRGTALLDEYTKDGNLVAREMFGQALELDPEYSRAHAGLALAFARAMMSGYEFSREVTTEKCMAAARQAVALDASDAYAHNLLGMAYLWARQYEEAVLTYQRAVELNPSYAHARASLGDTLNRIGRTDEGISLMEDALRLKPDAPNLRHFNAFLARACINARRYEDAVEWARKAIHLRSDLAHAHCLMAVALAHLGRIDESNAAIDACQREQPDFFDSAAELSPYQDAAANEHLLDGLRKAGVAQAIEQADGGQVRSDKPSIAVLPFDNMSGDPEQEYFSDGMAEDLITDLSKISNLSVAARNSSFSFKGQMPDIQDVVDKLRVAFVLEGSVRKMGDRLRINAQLIDGADGRHVWAERYDGNMAEIFDFQDRIRDEIVSALQVSLTPTDRVLTEHKPTDSVEAYDLFLKGRANFYRSTHEDVLEAIKCFEKAIEIDPNFADAYGYMSFSHVFGWVLMWPGFDNNLDLAHKLAERGVALDGTSTIAVMRLGWSQLWLRHYDQATANLEKAIAMAPNNAEVYSTFAQVLNYSGIPEKGLKMIEKAFSIDTFVPPLWEYQMGHSHLLLRQYDQALSRINRSIERAPKFTTNYLFLAWAYVELDRFDDAKETIKKAMEYPPHYSVRDVDRLFPYRIDEDRDRFLDALRKAGLPEGGEAENEAPPLPDKPSIAVLPFDNLSGDREQEYFSDGITEDIITALSHIRQFFVIARNTTFTYKGQAVDVPAVAKELGVRYVLEGSVRKAGNRVRITAQLIDGESGNHLWAERYDRDLEDIFEVQDDITQTVVGALGLELSRAEQERSRHKPPENMDAWDFYQRGLWHLWRFEKSDNERARELFQRATEIDPNLSPAFAALANTHVEDFFLGFTEDRVSAIEGAMQYAEQALKLDDREAIAYTARGATYLIRRDHPAARNDLKAALDIIPSYALALMLLGMTHVWCNEPDDARPYFDDAERVSPKDPQLWLSLMGRTLAFLIKGNFEDADAVGKRANAIPNAPLMPRLIHAAALGHLGRNDEAQAAIEVMLALNPGFCLKFANHILPTNEKKVREVVLDGLRKAGLPE